MYINYEICHKCNGSGYLEYYKHIADGICFTCKGTGLIEVRGTQPMPKPDPKAYYAEYKRKQEEQRKKWELERQAREAEKAKAKRIKDLQFSIEFLTNLLREQGDTMDDEMKQRIEQGIEKAKKELAGQV
jgi:hypothetical protein